MQTLFLLGQVFSVIIGLVFAVWAFCCFLEKDPKGIMCTLAGAALCFVFFASVDTQEEYRRFDGILSTNSDTTAFYFTIGSEKADYHEAYRENILINDASEIKCLKEKTCFIEVEYSCLSIKTCEKEQTHNYRIVRKGNP